MLRFALVFPMLLALLLPATAQTPAHHHHLRRHAAHKNVASAAKSVKVWVNTNSGVYHYAGERWYGNTKEGEYMSEDAAKKSGYRATENGQ